MDTDAAEKAGPSEEKKDGEEDSKKGEAASAPEPSTHTLENPARVVPAQVGVFKECVFVFVYVCVCVCVCVQTCIDGRG